MNKRIWVNIGLLAFIVLLYSVLTIPDEKDNQELPLLTNIDPNKITKIEVIRSELDDFIFEKQGDAWRMISPLMLQANNARINAMLRILKMESHGQLNSTEVDLQKFNLAEPAITIKLNDHAFQFGNTDAIDQRRYVLFDNNIHLTNDSLYAQLTTNAAFFADPKLLPMNIEINAIQFPDNKIELIDKQWRMQTLVDIKPEQLKRIAFSWQEATALSVSKYSAPEDASIISLSFSSGVTIKFIIVATEPHLILGRKDLGIQYHMGSDEAEKLLLIDPSATNVATESIVPE